MPLGSLDFSVTNREPIEAGDYPATFKKWSEKIAVEAGKYDMVAAVFEVEYEGEPRDVYRNYSESPKALIFLKRDLIALGADEDDFNSEPGKDTDLEAILNSCVGSECVLRIGHRSYTNAAGETVTTEDVSKVMPAGTVTATSWK